MSKAEQDFKDLTGEGENKDNDASKEFDDASKGIDDIKSSIDSVKDQISDLIINNSDTIDNYGKLGFKIVFSVLVVVDAGIAATMLLLCFCSGKKCSTCCCFKCAFRILLHVLWNVLAFLMFLTFLIGFLFTLIGTIGKDFVQVLSFIISEENLGKTNQDEIILLGDAAGKLNTCINGNGEISNELGINFDNMDILNELYETERKLIEIEESMNVLKNQKIAYNNYSNILDNRALYSNLKFGLKEIGRTNLITLEEKLNELNSVTQREVNERWGFDCSTPTTCGSSSNCEFSPEQICLNLEDNTCKSTSIIHNADPTQNSVVNPSPIQNRYSLCDRINTISNSNGPIINSIIYMQETANKDIDTVSTPESNKYIKGAIELINGAYDTFLNIQIRSVHNFRMAIHSLTGIFSGLISPESPLSDFLNCKFIGKNIKVVLKFLESSLGGNFYSVGICLLIAGFSLAISIIFTILLIIILNESSKSK